MEQDRLWIRANELAEELSIQTEYRGVADIRDRLIEEANPGNSYVQELVGDLYFRVEYGMRDYEKAVGFYKAASEGSASAKRKLAVCMIHGLGIEQDYEKAAALLEKAVSDGDLGSLLRYYDLYDKQLKMKRGESRFEEAGTLLERAMGQLINACNQEQAKPNQQMLVALAYQYGRFVVESKVQAMVYFLDLSNADRPEGKCIVGDRFMDPETGDYDEKMALELYESASEQGEIYAHKKLGSHYAESDPAQAAKYFYKAAIMGDRDSIVQILLLSEKGYVSDEQRSEVQSLAEILMVDPGSNSPVQSFDDNYLSWMGMEYLY